MIHAREDYNRIQDPDGLIPEDEPVFLIPGQDKIGAATVRFWMMVNRLIGGSEEMSMMAARQAIRMDEWPKKKMADL